ncbi:MAG: methyltransferase domain-containing protein [Spirochaetota bacterium]
MTEHKVFIYTAFGGRYGSGHLMRSLMLAKHLKSEGYDAIFLAEPNTPLSTEIERRHGKTYSRSILASTSAAAIICDRRELPEADIRSLRRTAPVIIMDSNGSETRIADIVIDQLPSRSKKAVNVRPFTCTVLSSAERTPKVRGKVEHIFVYAGAIRAFAEAVAKAASRFPSIRFTIVLGTDSNIPIPPNVTMSPVKEKYLSTLSRFDAVITYFGLTAFESALAGLPVMLLSPTNYHATLAAECGAMFYDIGSMRSGSEAISGRMFYLINKPAARKALIAEAKKSIVPERSMEHITRIIRGTAALVHPRCTACGAALTHIAARSENSNLYRCTACGSLTRKYFLPLAMKYEDDYFTTDYRAQYGRTYEDDFPAIRLLARRRLAIMKKLRPTGSLLDLGCALGFFLYEAREEGYDVSGIETSAYAASYAKKKFSIDVHTGGVERFSASRTYDVITAWYFLEHIDGIESMLSSVHRMLSPSGIFAFGMPNAAGISARMDRSYAARVPVDHRNEFTPNGMDMLMRKAGFVREHVAATGMHWPRAAGLLKLGMLSKNDRLASMYRTVAERFSLGDTFEGYYRKR